MKNVLVTGAGALLGQGILRCLNFSKNDYHIVSVDPEVWATGNALANVCYKVPYISDPGYKLRIEEIISKENIHIILIGTDVELPFFAEHKAYLEETYTIKVLVSKSSVIKIANSKWFTAEFLRKNDFPFPSSALTSDISKIEKLKSKCKYPFIAKPDDGARSKGIEILENEEDLIRICGYTNNLIVQELLSSENGEFTTGCIVVEKKCVALVSMVRDLRDGNTWRAYRVDKSPYDTVIASIAETLEVEGPVNFQYRIRENEPVVFEINCRFSGTTPIRYMFGFNEVEALLNFHLNGEPIEQPELRKGTVLRTISDVFVKNETLERFEENGVTNMFDCEYYPFKIVK
jgi:carbamoyl-phosphate synthase large subunit